MFNGRKRKFQGSQKSSFAGAKRLRGASKFPRGVSASSRVGRRQVATGLLSNSISPGIPDRTIVKLRWSQYVGFASTSGAVTNFLVRANSLFDPGQTTGTLRPQYYPELGTLYGNYTVTASKIRCKFITTSTIPMALAIFPSDTTTAASFADASSKPYAKSSYNASGSGVWNPQVYLPSNKAFGVSKKTIMAEASYTGAVNANPSAQWYWQIWAQSSDGSTTGNCACSIEVTYYAMLSNRLSPSLT